MSEDVRTRRLTGPSSAAERSTGAGLASPTLVSLLAHTTRLVDLLPPLHQHALDVTGGSRLLLFEHNPRNGVLQATSGFGLDALPTEPWMPAPDEAAIVSDAFTRGTPIVVTDADRDMPRASTDPDQAANEVQIPADEPLSPAAVAMRRARAEILTGGSGLTIEEEATVTVTVPLRGTRRALGTVVFDGVRVEPGGEMDLLDRADELGRQLSNAVENLSLLDDVMRSQRELEDTFDSIAHLVVVFDRLGRIVH